MKTSIRNVKTILGSLANGCEIYTSVYGSNGVTSVTVVRDWNSPKMQDFCKVLGTAGFTGIVKSTKVLEIL